MIPRANVYNLRHLDNPPDFRYFLDTNILKFIFARTVLGEKGYQIEHYPTFLKSLKQNQRRVFTLVQNILELFGVLDALEKSLKGIGSIKEYRQNELSVYLDTRREIYNDVNRSLDILQAEITTRHIETYFDIDISIDIKDYIYYQIANDPEIAFVSDDTEFIQFEGLNLFTANFYVIERAERVKKLMKP